MKSVLLFWLLIAGAAQAFAFDFGDGSVSIPDGFEGPISNSMGQGATVFAFSYPHNSDEGALLQITIFDPGQPMPKVSEDQLKAYTKQYLLEFLGGVERRRTNFARGDVQFIHISNQPAAKVTWSGLVNGRNAHGAMYCLIYNSKIYSFHTQDYVSFSEKYTQLAAQAFEGIVLER